MRIILTALTLVGVLATAGWAADAKAGKTAYEKSCRVCHGSDGAGNAAIAKMMKVNIKDLKSSEVQSMSDDELKKVITDGKGKMKPVTAVSGAAVDNVIAYVRSLKK